MGKIDMHFHTTLSDWKKSNEEILKMIDPKKVDFLIATEHDIVNSDFKNSLDNLEIPTVYGVEISACDYDNKKSMHILHYSSEVNKLLNQRLENIRNSCEIKIIRQVEKLRENGFFIDYDEMINYYKSKWINTSNLVAYHIAEYIFRDKKNIEIIEKISGISNINIVVFYKNFLKRGWNFAHIWHFNVWDYEFDVKDFNAIRVPNSIVSLTHPNVTFKNDIDAFVERIEKLVPLWINAIEVNPIATKKWLDIISYIQAKYDLILTFGSDCHFKETFDWKHSQLFQINQELSKNQINENMYRIKDRLGIN